MDVEEDEAVARLMRRMVEGDEGAVFDLVEQFGDRLAWVVRRHLHDLGRFDLARDRHEVRELAFDAALVIEGRAAGWRPGGAKPWTWATRAIRDMVVRTIGHPTVELDADRHLPAVGMGATVRFFEDEREGGGAGADGSGWVDEVLAADDFERLARRDPRVALLRQAIGEVASLRDQVVHIQYSVQKGMGDVSPAHTVAAELGLRPDNVRQIHRRVRQKLARLIEADARYASLREIGWLAA